MKKQEFDKFCRDACASAEDEMKRKGPDYTDSGDDRHSNFKDIAARIGLMPIQVWGVYFLKHIAAIERYIRDGELSSEPIEGRMKDGLNYILLGWSLVQEGGAFELRDDDWRNDKLDKINSVLRTTTDQPEPPGLPSLDDGQTVGQSGNEAPPQLYRERPLTDVTEEILKDQKAAMGEEAETNDGQKGALARLFEGKGNSK